MSRGKMPCVLSVAGSDCSGGAGIQADLKTMAAHGVYGMAAVTAVTAQNTLGVRCVQPVPDKLLEEQLACVFEDIMPDAVKIGMLTDERSVYTVAAALSRYQARHVVIDPVMVSTSGGAASGAGGGTGAYRSTLPAGGGHHAQPAGSQGTGKGRGARG